ncbi:Lytic transglycosylase catalytic [Shewanella halifaxensis HAW-EB4]|uniref:Lytic transglycosylase catalytic n=1 Tax=Shewanella halifaxensis (strain HAW-EB4) TaxID=458817 RepID=B0TM51_SHEHH|nr:murein transglycosylase domain-containing protein [Shewanella halifaxensis]ABZ74644.1 Lytic transglycosylase catalytic [Shewanella halifaxensis HAW-EB4]
MSKYLFQLLIAIYCLIAITLANIASANSSELDLSDYDADVAALLLEYQGQDSYSRPIMPSVLVFNESEQASTYVDFKRGLILVETRSKTQLKDAVVQVLLTQIDPKVIDAQTAQDFGLISKKKKPFFWGQVLDREGKEIEFQWRASRYADDLVAKSKRVNSRFRVAIHMVKEHTQIAGNKYINYARSASRKHGISTDLIMAIMETESSFNPLARSRSNALGLMQIKANTAGRDYFSLIQGYTHTPSSAYLYDPAKNIEVGTGYLKILSTRYLAGIKHPKKREYAVISSYNGGAGNLWKSLDPRGNRTKALARINKMTVSEFYWFLTHRHNRQETRNYLKKVSSRQKKYL